MPYVPAPGTALGPCINQQCGHVRCQYLRKIAAAKCTTCGKPIGYESRYRRNEDGSGFTHTACVYTKHPEEDT